MGVTVRIDSHKSLLAVAVLDDLGGPLGVREFANNPTEHENLRRWIASHGDARVIGVEGSGNFGAALTRHLLENGEEVREVPAFLSHRERKKSPARGKSDPQDALAIAHVAARGDGLSAPQRTETFQDLKLLSEHRDQLVRARTQLINRTHKNLVVSHPGYEQQRRLWKPWCARTRRVLEVAARTRSDDVKVEGLAI
jgi:transposase